MKTILLAALALVAAAAPVQAVARTFVVKSVNIMSPQNKFPTGAPSFKKGAIVKLNITKKKVTGPKKISIPSKKKSAAADVYNKSVPKQGKSDTATVRKNKTKVIAVELSFTRKVSQKFMGRTVKTTGMVTYILEPK